MNYYKKSYKVLKANWSMILEEAKKEDLGFTPASALAAMHRVIGHGIYSGHGGIVEFFTVGSKEVCLGRYVNGTFQFSKAI